MRKIVGPLFAAYAFLAAPAAMSRSQSIMLSGTNIILSDSIRAGSITVGSGSGEFASFELSESAFIQQADGKIVSSTQANVPNSAMPFLRVGPKRFTVEPGRGLEVRVAARPPANLAPGEYRAHFSVMNTGSQAGDPTESIKADLGEGISVVIPIRIARAVRVLYRHQVRPEGGRLGAVSRAVEGSDVVASFGVTRLGVTSLLAKTEVIARDAGGKELGRWDGPGINIYPENASRVFAARVPSASVPKDARLCVLMTVTDPGAKGLAPVEACAS